MDIDPKYDDYDFPVEAPEPQSGHAGHLTPEQIAQVHQLRLMLEAEGLSKRLDTLTLLRFLRARKFDVQASKTMFVDTEKWRQEIDLDNILPGWEFPEKEQLSKYYKQYYHKTDNDGRPIYIETFDGIDINIVKQITTEERMLKNLAVEYERCADPRLPACSRKAGKLLETCCTIMDLKGVGLFGIKQVYEGYVKQASAMSQNHYPERLGQFFLINAPWGFATVWYIMKGWLDPVTVNKIHILGSSYQKELLAQVPAENLPKALGGSCSCEGGCENSDAGPWREAEWAKPAKWEKEQANVIDNTADGEVEKPEVTTGVETTTAPEKSGAAETLAA